LGDHEGTTTIKKWSCIGFDSRDSCGRNLQVSGISAKEANECSIKPINDRFSNNGQEPRPGIILCRRFIAFLHWNVLCLCMLAILLHRFEGDNHEGDEAASTIFVNSVNGLTSCLMHGSSVVCYYVSGDCWTFPWYRWVRLFSSPVELACQPKTVFRPSIRLPQVTIPMNRGT
jgi:hypothetical protein